LEIQLTNVSINIIWLSFHIDGLLPRSKKTGLGGKSGGKMGALPEYGCCRVVAMVVGSLVSDFTPRANFDSLKIFKRSSTTAK
jgi:hypothetical protein